MAELRDLLRKAGYRFYTYSGRAMYGRRCLAVDLPKTVDLFQLALDLAEQLPADEAMPDQVNSFSLDDMGRGIVVYWRHEKWQAEWERFDPEADYPWRCLECRLLNKVTAHECDECGYVPEEDED